MDNGSVLVECPAKHAHCRPPCSDSVPSRKAQRRLSQEKSLVNRCLIKIIPREDYTEFWREKALLKNHIYKKLAFAKI
jgi:hypothetical protein